MSADVRSGALDDAASLCHHDLLELLRDPVIRVISHGPEANEAFMRAFRPDYVRTRANMFGEVWEPAQR